MRTIPFDLSKAKTPENPNGLEVIDESGKKIQILCTNLNHKTFPIAAIRPHGNNEEGVACYTKEGRCNKHCNKPYNLLLLAPEPKHIEVWGILFEDEEGGLTTYPYTFPTRERAEERAKTAYVGKTIVAKFYEYTEEQP